MADRFIKTESKFKVKSIFSVLQVLLSYVVIEKRLNLLSITYYVSTQFWVLTEI